MRSTLVHLARAALVASIATTLVAGTVLAAKGGGTGGATSGTGTIVLRLMDGATEPHYGARVTFDVATTATTSPFVHLRCSQGGTLVLEGWQGFFDTAIGNQWFYLGPTKLWTGGAADCTATLEKSTRKGWGVLATTTFHVYP